MLLVFVVTGTGGTRSPSGFRERDDGHEWFLGRADWIVFAMTVRTDDRPRNARPVVCPYSQSWPVQSGAYACVRTPREGARLGRTVDT
jgi:hypothetical protein